MAQTLAAEEELQGQALSSFGATMCQPRPGRHGEPRPERRHAETGKAVERW
jgi:hypothetical protein